MDQYGDQVRQLKATQPLRFDEDLSNQMAQYQAMSRFRNLRGEPAHPNLIGEYGAMSWREYDAIKARGEDPEDVSWHNKMRRQDKAQARRDSMPGRSMMSDIIGKSFG